MQAIGREVHAADEVIRLFAAFARLYRGVAHTAGGDVHRNCELYDAAVRDTVREQPRGQATWSR